MKSVINKIGKGIAIACLAGMLVPTIGAGVVLAMSADINYSMLQQPTVLYLSNELAYAPAYKVQMNDAVVMLASKDDVVAMLDLVQKKYNKDDSYKVRLIQSSEENNKEQYKTVILPSGKMKHKEQAQISFKEDVTILSTNVELNKVLTVKDAVDEVTDKKNRKLSVVIQEKEVSEEKYNKKVKYIKTDSLSKGEKKVTNKGKKGLREVETVVTYTNGKETDRQVVDKNVIKEAVAKTVLVGTKEEGFIIPMKNINVSSSFGSRWGRRHSGTDFTTSIGTPVMASRSGVVTHAGWMSGYGYLVTIDHGDGYETKYAHLNSMNVTVGQKVSQGELIAKSGNTGRSTGPHLHFEIVVNGTPVNAMNYLK